MGNHIFGRQGRSKEKVKHSLAQVASATRASALTGVDDEAQVLYAVYLAATQTLTDKTYAASLKAARILEQRFKKHPQPPEVDCALTASS